MERSDNYLANCHPGRLLLIPGKCHQPSTEIREGLPREGAMGKLMRMEERDNEGRSRQVPKELGNSEAAGHTRDAVAVSGSV